MYLVPRPCPFSFSTLFLSSLLPLVACFFSSSGCAFSPSKECPRDLLSLAFISACLFVSRSLFYLLSTPRSNDHIIRCRLLSHRLTVFYCLQLPGSNLLCLSSCVQSASTLHPSSCVQLLAFSLCDQTHVVQRDEDKSRSQPRRAQIQARTCPCAQKDGSHGHHLVFHPPVQHCSVRYGGMLPGVGKYIAQGQVWREKCE